MTSEAKVLYLCGEVPVPSDTGGKVAFMNHIDYLTQYHKTDAVFIDSDGDRKSLPNVLGTKFNNYKIFGRQFRKANNLIGYLTAVYLFLRYNYPRAYSVRINRKAKKYIADHIEKYELIIFDHFASFAILNDFNLQQKPKIIYISHNVESSVIDDQRTLSRNPIKKVLLQVEFIRTKMLERKIFSYADKVTAMSLKDVETIEKKFKGFKAIYLPEVIKATHNVWKPNSNKIVTFLGGSKYFPNYEAIYWIVKQLIPKISNEHNIIFRIIGKVDNFLSDHPNEVNLASIEFVGYIDDSELDKYLLESSIVISPVIYGSGIKIKVLKSINLGIPIFCTIESLNGMEYLKDIKNIIFDRNSPLNAANKLVDLLNNHGDQLDLSSEIFGRYFQQKLTADNQWQNILENE